MSQLNQNKLPNELREALHSVAKVSHELGTMATTKLKLADSMLKNGEITKGQYGVFTRLLSNMITFTLE